MSESVQVSGELTREVIQALSHLHEAPEGGSHGKLTPEVLVQMLLEDVALAVGRPGSWEGANMAKVLSAHGYTI